MTDSIIEKIQGVQVEAGLKYFVMVWVSDEVDARAKSDLITEIKDGYEALGCSRADIAVVVMQGLVDEGVVQKLVRRSPG